MAAWPGPPGLVTPGHDPPEALGISGELKISCPGHTTVAAFDSEPESVLIQLMITAALACRTVTRTPSRTRIMTRMIWTPQAVTVHLKLPGWNLALYDIIYDIST